MEEQGDIRRREGQGAEPAGSRAGRAAVPTRGGRGGGQARFGGRAAQPGPGSTVTVKLQDALGPRGDPSSLTDSVWPPPSAWGQPLPSPQG